MVAFSSHLSVFSPRASAASTSNVGPQTNAVISTEACPSLREGQTKWRDLKISDTNQERADAP